MKVIKFLGIQENLTNNWYTVNWKKDIIYVVDIPEKDIEENTEDLPELPVANGQLDKNEEEIWKFT